jgi:hypothetical protein
MALKQRRLKSPMVMLLVLKAAPLNIRVNMLLVGYVPKQAYIVSYVNHHLILQVAAIPHLLQHLFTLKLMTILK